MGYLHHHRLALVALGLFLVACGEEPPTSDPGKPKTHRDAGPKQLEDAGPEPPDDAGPEVPDDAGPPDPELACEVDSALLASSRRCVSDTHCPCGAHCDLGVCVAACTSSAECDEGSVCDEFGRCRAEGIRDRVPPRRQSDQGRAHIEQSLVTYVDDDTPRRLTVVARDGPIDAIRVVAGAGAKVALPELGVDDRDLDFVSELVIRQRLAQGASLEIVVMPDGGDPDAQEGFGSVEIQVFDSGGNVERVVLSDQAPGFGQAALVDAPPLVGRYEGSARLSLAGLAGRGGFQGQAPGSALWARLKVEIYEPVGERAVVVIEDPLRMVHPSGRWVGELVLDDAPHLELPTFEVLPETPVAASSVQALAVPRDAELLNDPRSPTWDGGLHAALEVELVGVSASERTPRLVWSLDLSRVADLPTDAVAPAVDEDAAPAYDPDAWAETPFAWEQSWRDAVHPSLDRVECLFFCGPDNSDRRFGWSRLRGQSNAAPPGSCVSLDDPQIPDVNRRWLVRLFAVEAWGGPFPAYSGGALGTIITGAANPSDWSHLLTKSEDMAGLNGPLFSVMTNNLRQTAGPEEGPPVSAAIAALGGDAGSFKTDMPTLDGGTLRNVAVCGIDFSAASDPPPQSVTYQGATVTLDVDAPPPSVDVCDALAAQRECVIVDLTAQVAPADRAGGMTLWMLTDGGELVFDFGTIHATRGCIVPSTPSACAETVLCDDDSEGAFDVSALSSSVDGITGDLACRETSRGAWRDADITPTAAATLLERCAQDLEAFYDLPPTPSGETARERLDSIGWHTEAECIDAARTLTLLGVAGEHARQLTPLMEVRQFDTADTLFARRLQQLLSLYAFIASDAEQRAKLPPEVSGTTQAALEQALSDSLDGWDLLLHPRVGSALAGLTPSALAEPDYRRRIVQGTLPQRQRDTQREGLIVTMQRTLTAQMELAAHIAGVASRHGASELPPTVQRTLRQAALIEAWISGLSARAERHEDGPRWRAELERTRAQLDVASGRVTTASRSILHGSNPLGIEDSDLPLYFRQVATDAGSRYTAITDFILGAGPTGNAVAQVLVASAQGSFDAARTAYLAEEQRLVNAENNEAARQLRIATATQDLGQTLQDLCGREAFAPLEDYEIPAALPADFDVASCWYRAERAECQIDPPAPNNDDRARIERELQLSALHNEVCQSAFRMSLESHSYCTEIDTDPIAAVLRRPCTQNVLYRVTPKAPVLAEIQRRALEAWSGFDTVTEVLLAEDGEVFESDIVLPRVGGTFQICANEAAAGMSPRPEAPLPEVELDEDGERVFLRCRPAAGLSGAPIVMELEPGALIPSAAEDAKPLAARGVSACWDAFPVEAPRRSEARFDVIPASCYRGQLGSQAISLKSLVADIEIARGEHQDAIDAYEIAMESCYLLQRGNQALQDTMSSYVNERRALVELRTGMEIAALIANNTADCLDTLAGAEGTTGYVLGGASCAARGVEAVFHTIQLVTEANIDALETAHEANMLAIENATEESRCFKEAELELVGANTAVLSTLLAMQSLQIGYAEFHNELEQAELAVTRGFADIADAEESGVRSIDRDPWFDRDIATYGDRLLLARRGAYLAVRAVEYEFQMSLTLRATVLRAEHPDELADALTSLRQITATGSVNGNQPAELTEVVSLRRHLLQLQDQSDAPAGEQALSEVERFRLLLQDPRYEVYQDGVFVGRAIPFQLAPLSVLGRGQSNGVPIVSDSSCAERLWSVNVSIQGDPAATFRGVAPQVNLQIRKRNTAYSTWCDPGEQEAAFQMVTARPKRNLFRAPGTGEGVSLDSGNPKEAFSTARVQALLDIEPARFLSDDYTDGASTELAARPLFGDYELFIPATSLVEVNARGEIASDGLVLNAVEDILLRVDYLSVAN